MIKTHFWQVHLKHRDSARADDPAGHMVRREDGAVMVRRPDVPRSLPRVLPAARRPRRPPPGQGGPWLVAQGGKGGRRGKDRAVPTVGLEFADVRPVGRPLARRGEAGSPICTLFWSRVSKELGGWVGYCICCPKVPPGRPLRRTTKNKGREGPHALGRGIHSSRSIFSPRTLL